MRGLPLHSDPGTSASKRWVRKLLLLPVIGDAGGDWLWVVKLFFAIFLDVYMCVKKKSLPGSFRGCKCSEFWVAWVWQTLEDPDISSRESCHINFINIFWALIGMTCHEDHGDQATGGGGMREDQEKWTIIFCVCFHYPFKKMCLLMPHAPENANITWKCTPPSRMTVTTRIHTVTCSVRNPL